MNPKESAERKTLKVPRSRPLFQYYFHNLALIAKGLLSRHPISAPDGMLSCVPFFIIGSGRSGNTLLRAILTAHPTICIPPESYVLGKVIRNYRFYSFLPWEMSARLVISEFESHPHFYTWEIDLTSFYQTALQLPKEKRNLATLLDAFYGYYSEQKCPGSHRWGDKTPLNTFALPLIDQVFPRAQYVHIVRDGRDVVASYLAAGLYSSVSDACERWLRSVAAAQRFGAKIGPKRYREIRYEELVGKPEETSRAVCAFLDMDYRPEQLLFWKRSDQLGDTELMHHQNVHNPINAQSVGNWEVRLDKTAKLEARRVLGPKLQELGYPVE